MNTVTVKLGDLIDVKHGYAFDGAYFADEGEYVLLTPGSFHETGGYRDQGDKQKFYTADPPDEFVLVQGDLLVAMTEQAPGLLGSPLVVPESGRFLHNQRLGLITVKDRKRLDKRYLFHLFNTHQVRGMIAASASGTKVRHTSPVRIQAVDATIPADIRVQQRIADAAGAYDSLIQTNTRRIALLERAARLLYEEWFVWLRFPGRDRTPVADGLPSGWDRRSLGAVAALNYGKALSEENRREGEVPVYGSSGVVGTHNAAYQNGPAIVVGRKGNVGSVALVPGQFWPIDTVYFIAPDRFSYYLYHNLCKQRFLNSDGAVPGLNRNYAHTLPLLLPPQALRRRFEDAVAPIHEQVWTLERTNAKLREARDLLLPRLMSGAVSV